MNIGNSKGKLDQKERRNTSWFRYGLIKSLLKSDITTIELIYACSLDRLITLE